MKLILNYDTNVMCCVCVLFEIFSVYVRVLYRILELIECSEYKRVAGQLIHTYLIS